MHTVDSPRLCRGFSRRTVPFEHVFLAIDIINVKSAAHEPESSRECLRRDIVRPNRQHEIRHALLHSRPTHECHRGFARITFPLMFRKYTESQFRRIFGHRAGILDSRPPVKTNRPYHSARFA